MDFTYIFTTLLVITVGTAKESDYSGRKNPYDFG